MTSFDEVRLRHRLADYLATNVSAALTKSTSTLR
jgi:hypothetical protein